MTEIPYPKEDVKELDRFRALIKNQWLASDVQLPDEHFLQPNRDHHHYDVHVTEPTGMTVINTFHFKTKEACLAAIAHVKRLLPQPEPDKDHERTDSQATTTIAPEVGSETEGSEKDLESHSPPGTR